jgi:hypothetical protein
MLASLGVPMTEEMRLSWSASSLPGNSGLPSSISARMQPARTKGFVGFDLQFVISIEFSELQKGMHRVGMQLGPEPARDVYTWGLNL